MEMPKPMDAYFTARARAIKEGPRDLWDSQRTGWAEAPRNTLVPAPMRRRPPPGAPQFLERAERFRRGCRAHPVGGRFVLRNELRAAETGRASLLLIPAAIGTDLTRR